MANTKKKEAKKQVARFYLIDADLDAKITALKNTKGTAKNHTVNAAIRQYFSRGKF